jgi:hypothetical protein
VSNETTNDSDGDDSDSSDDSSSSGDDGETQSEAQTTTIHTESHKSADTTNDSEDSDDSDSSDDSSSSSDDDDEETQSEAQTATVHTVSNKSADTRAKSESNNETSDDAETQSEAQTTVAHTVSNQSGKTTIASDDESEASESSDDDEETEARSEAQTTTAHTVSNQSADTTNDSDDDSDDSDSSDDDDDEDDETEVRSEAQTTTAHTVSNQSVETNDTEDDASEASKSEKSESEEEETASEKSEEESESEEDEEEEEESEEESEVEDSKEDVSSAPVSPRTVGQFLAENTVSVKDTPSNEAKERPALVTTRSRSIFFARDASIPRNYISETDDSREYFVETDKSLNSESDESEKIEAVEPDEGAGPNDEEALPQKQIVTTVEQTRNAQPTQNQESSVNQAKPQPKRGFFARLFGRGRDQPGNEQPPPRSDVVVAQALAPSTDTQMTNAVVVANIASKEPEQISSSVDQSQFVVYAAPSKAETPVLENVKSPREPENVVEHCDPLHTKSSETENVIPTHEPSHDSFIEIHRTKGNIKVAHSSANQGNTDGATSVETSNRVDEEPDNHSSEVVAAQEPAPAEVEQHDSVKASNPGIEPTHDMGGAIEHSDEVAIEYTTEINDASSHEVPRQPKNSEASELNNSLNFAIGDWDYNEDDFGCPSEPFASDIHEADTTNAIETAEEPSSRSQSKSKKRKAKKTQNALNLFGQRPEDVPFDEPPSCDEFDSESEGTDRCSSMISGDKYDSSQRPPMEAHPRDLEAGQPQREESEASSDKAGVVKDEETLKREQRRLMLWWPLVCCTFLLLIAVALLVVLLVLNPFSFHKTAASNVVSPHLNLTHPTAAPTLQPTRLRPTPTPNITSSIPPGPLLSEHPTHSPTTVAPSFAKITPSPTPLNRFTATIQFLSKAGVSDLAKLRSAGTPQNLAATWLANNDPGDLSVPGFARRLVAQENSKFIARYVMAVLYFALGGTGWTSRAGFLTRFRTCYWSETTTASQNLGVTCDQNGYIVGISLRKFDVTDCELRFQLTVLHIVPHQSLQQPHWHHSK